MYERLLLASDGSELSAAAVPHAAALARVTGAGVLALRVSRRAGEAVDALGPETWARQIELGAAEAPDGERAEAHPPLSLTVAALLEAGVQRAGSLVVRGEPGERIVDVATRLSCDAIVMTSHGLTGMRRAALGSVADHVIRHSPGLPVLIAPPPAGEPPAAYERILVALDGSDLSETLLPHVERLAANGGLEVVLVRVIDPAFRILTMTTPAGYPLTPGLTEQAAEELVRAQRSTAEEHLGAVAQRLGGAGVGSVTTRVVEGEPGEAILAAAEDASCDLMLLATHGRSGLGRALLGSVTDYVTRNLATAAVLVVPPADRAG